MKIEIEIPQGMVPYLDLLAETGLYGHDTHSVAILLIRDGIRSCVADGFFERPEEAMREVEEKPCRAGCFISRARQSHFPSLPKSPTKCARKASINQSPKPF